MHAEEFAQQINEYEAFQKRHMQKPALGGKDAMPFDGKIFGQIGNQGPDGNFEDDHPRARLGFYLNERGTITIHIQAGRAQQGDPDFRNGRQHPMSDIQAVLAFIQKEEGATRSVEVTAAEAESIIENAEAEFQAKISALGNYDPDRDGIRPYLKAAIEWLNEKADQCAPNRQKPNAGHYESPATRQNRQDRGSYRTTEKTNGFFQICGDYKVMVHCKEATDGDVILQPDVMHRTYDQTWEHMDQDPNWKEYYNSRPQFTSATKREAQRIMVLLKENASEMVRQICQEHPGPDQIQHIRDALRAEIFTQTQ